MAEAMIRGRAKTVNYAKDWEYTVNDTTALITKYIGENTTVTVPTKIDGRAVVLQNSTDSATGVFTNNQNIVSVTIPETVVVANNNMANAFYNCYNLVNAPEIPNSVKNMYATFEGCTNLVNAPVIPDSVTRLVNTFRNCHNLVNAPAIPNGVTSMWNTFYDCYNLVNAPVIPNSVTDMVSTFQSCSNLVNAPVIPNSVTNMYQTFGYCANLTGHININSTKVTNMINCFYGTTKSKSVYVPAGSTTYTTASSAISGKNGVTLYTF